MMTYVVKYKFYLRYYYFGKYIYVFLTKATHSLLPSVKGKASIFIRNLKLLRYKIELSNWLADRDLQSAISGQRSAVGGQRSAVGGYFCRSLRHAQHIICHACVIQYYCARNNIRSRRSIRSCHYCAALLCGIAPRVQS